MERAGGWYHVTARGNERREIFYQDSDRRHFLELLPGLVEMFRVRLHAYVLMPNHYHLLLEIQRKKPLISHFTRLILVEAPNGPMPVNRVKPWLVP
jgi:REP element-mobilizing transposase RayT